MLVVGEMVVMAAAVVLATWLFIVSSFPYFSYWW